MALNGIDISKWQGNIDLSVVPCDFVIIKATQGIGYVSEYFDSKFSHDGSITVIGYSLPEFCFELLSSNFPFLRMGTLNFQEILYNPLLLDHTTQNRTQVMNNRLL